MRASTSVAAAQQMDPSEVQRGLRLSVLEGLLATVFITLTLDPFLTGFILLLGAAPQVVGLLEAVLALVRVIQPAAVYLIHWAGRRRPLACWLLGLGRYIWVVLAFLPFLPGSVTVKLLIFSGILLVATVLIELGVNVWSDWMVDLVPAGMRGRYFGLRNAVLATFGMVVLWLGGRWLDGFRSSGREALGFLGLFAAAGLAALLAQLTLSVQPDVQRRFPPADSGLLWRPFSSPGPYRRFLAFAGLWHLCASFSWAYYNVYALKYLGFSYAFISLYTNTATAVALLTQPLWGRYVDRVGPLRVLRLGTIGVAFLPALWIGMTPELSWPVWLDMIGSGIFWPAVSLSFQVMLFRVAPAEHRSVYLGTFAGLTGTMIALAAALGSAVLTLFAGGVWGWNAFQWLFLITTAGRVIAWLVLLVGPFGDGERTGRPEPLSD